MPVKKIFSHANMHYAGLVLLAISLPVSNFVMSLAQIILSVVWLTNGNAISKFKQFFQSKAALLFTSIILLHLLGLLYTQDFQYAWHDIKIKLPLLILPLIISTGPPLSEKKLNILFAFLTASVLTSTLISLNIFLQQHYNDIREISPFISHIRLSLLVCFSVFILMRWTFTSAFIKSIAVKLFLCIVVLWFISFLILLQSLTGLGIILVVSIGLILYYIYRLQFSWIIKIGLYILFIIPIAVGGVYLKHIYDEACKRDVVAVSKLPIYTSHHHLYYHNLDAYQTENGHYVWLYVCDEELHEAWKKRSAYDYDSLDNRSQHLKYTLMHFLSSKGYTKDADGLAKLSNQEIRAIEKGITNVEYMEGFSLKSRVNQVIGEYTNYKKTGNPNAYSVMQRVEYWKASYHIMASNCLIGVGTGDIDHAFQEYYTQIKSPLEQRWRLRSHNQYLAIGVAFGLVGLVWFLMALFYSPLKNYKNLDYYFFVFLSIAGLSMLTEDTLETQAGVTFVAFFYALLYLGRERYFKQTYK